jgi:hypothetical protein
MMTNCKHERLEVDGTLAGPRRPVRGNAICSFCKEPQPFVLFGEKWIPVKGGVGAGFFPADEEGER